MTTALVMMTDPGNPEANGRMVHLLKTTAALRDAGEGVAVYLHGAGVNWATAFAVREDNFTQHYGESFDDVKPLIAGACNFCANVRFGQTEALATLGIGVLGGEGAHHTVADLVVRGDRVVTF
ncbi:MAG: hypothetical protein OEM97_01175 [Acidimicrobiia bacterium]|nr:hypothetical protein [Acidimicrobiia bacterium]